MKPSNPRLKGALIFAISASLISGLVQSVGAELLFADSFDYPVGGLAGNGPPPGSPPGQGPWSAAHANPKVSPQGLEFPGLFSLGHSALVHGFSVNNGDSAAANFSGVTPDLGTVWVGFLVNQRKRSRDGYAVVSLGTVVDGPVPGIGALYFKDLYGIDNNTGNSADRSATTVIPSRDAVWLVTKLDFAGGGEYVWVNPSPAMEPDINEADANLPMTDYFQANGFSLVEIRAGYTLSAYQFDELRIGTDFFDVVGQTTVE